MSQYISMNDMRKVLLREYLKDSGKNAAQTKSDRLKVMAKKYHVSWLTIYQFVRGNKASIPDCAADALGYDSKLRYFRKKNGAKKNAKSRRHDAGRLANNARKAESSNGGSARAPRSAPRDSGPGRAAELSQQGEEKIRA